MTTEPTDAELKAMWQLHAADIGGIFYYARAVLAKWGTPAGAGAPVAPDFYTACAWYEGGGEAGWIPLPGYSNETEHGVRHLVLEAARKEGYKGTAAGRLTELNWEIRPVYLTPQPVAREPISNFDAADAFMTEPHTDDVFEAFHQGIRFAEQHHGIKGGQHEST